MGARDAKLTMISTGAILSTCGTYRYKLWRIWDHALRPMVFIMLNPSTADASVNDPTIRKCIGFARRKGFGGIVVVNLFAYRATNPNDLRAAGYPAGPDNLMTIQTVLTASRWQGAPIVCAWGANARNLDAARKAIDLVRSFNRQPMALRLSEDGTPWHPLMLPYSCELVAMP